MMHGLLLIDKPEGITSAEVVRVVKRQLRCKTGHLGTLDPFASGVLPVCIGGICIESPRKRRATSASSAALHDGIGALRIREPVRSPLSVS